jgi:hypothetical protein
VIKQFDEFWWQIKSSDMGVDVITDDRIIQATVTESMGEMDTCTISILDPNVLYSRMFRNGVEFEFDWGTLADKRGAIKFLVNSPSGSGDANGQVIFNMRGQALGDEGTNRKYYNVGTKGTIVLQTLVRMGIADAEIDFERMSEVVNNDNKIAQYESDFRFLARLADEWRCVFRIGVTKAGTKCAVFCEPAKLSYKLFQKKIVLTSCHLEYGGGLANVINYSWQDTSLDASQGSAVNVRYVNGVPQYYRYIAKDEQVITYRLNEEAIQAEWEAQDTIEDKSEFVKNIMKVKTFKEVERFFIQDTITTAPQGSGLTIKVHMFGDINVTAGQVATFGQGFPDRLGAKDRTWYIKSVTHSMGTSGYFCDLEIVDAYVFSPTGQKL